MDQSEMPIPDLRIHRQGLQYRYDTLFPYDTRQNEMGHSISETISNG